MALIAPIARVYRSTPDYGDRRVPTTERCHVTLLAVLFERRIQILVVPPEDVAIGVGGQHGPDRRRRPGRARQRPDRALGAPASRPGSTGPALNGSLEPGAAQAAQERCARRAPGRHAGSA